MFYVFHCGVNDTREKYVNRIPQKFVGVKFMPNPSSQAPPQDDRGQCERYISEANFKKIEMANMRHPGFRKRNHAKT
jgi:hypothetical protein